MDWLKTSTEILWRYNLQLSKQKAVSNRLALFFFKLVSEGGKIKVILLSFTFWLRRIWLTKPYLLIGRLKFENSKCYYKHMDQVLSITQKTVKINLSSIGFTT